MADRNIESWPSPSEWVASNNQKNHIVAKGETFSGIALQHGYKNWRELAKLQWPNFNPNKLNPGDTINIPVNTAAVEKWMSMAQKVTDHATTLRKIDQDLAAKELDKMFAQEYPVSQRTSTPDIYPKFGNWVEQNDAKINSMIASLKDVPLESLPFRLTRPNVRDNWNEFLAALDNNPAVKIKIQQMIAKEYEGFQGKTFFGNKEKIDPSTIVISWRFENFRWEWFEFQTWDKRYVFARPKNYELRQSPNGIIVLPYDDTVNVSVQNSTEKRYSPNRFDPKSIYTEGGGSFWSNQLRPWIDSLSPTNKEFLQKAILYGIKEGKFWNGWANAVIDPTFDKNLQYSDITIINCWPQGVEFSVGWKVWNLHFNTEKQAFRISQEAVTRNA